MGTTSSIHQVMYSEKLAVRVELTEIIMKQWERKNIATRNEKRVKDREQQKGAASNELSSVISKQRRANNVEQTASEKN